MAFAWSLGYSSFGAQPLCWSRLSSILERPCNCSCWHRSLSRQLASTTTLMSDHALRAFQLPGSLWAASADSSWSKDELLKYESKWRIVFLYAAIVLCVVEQNQTKGAQYWTFVQVTRPFLQADVFLSLVHSSASTVRGHLHSGVLLGRYSLPTIVRGVACNNINVYVSFKRALFQKFFDLSPPWQRDLNHNWVHLITFITWVSLQRVYTRKRKNIYI